jgi:release factor glutamine methyltransferase
LADEISGSGLARSAKVLDLCSGSGILGITAARSGAATVTAVDLALPAVVNTVLNAWRNHVSLEARRGDLFAPVGDQTFDLIVSNPPYLPAPADELPRRGTRLATDAGRDGRALLERICRGARDRLRPGGSLLLVQSSVAGTSESLAQLSGAGLDVRVARRHRGPFGARLRARAEMLRERGLIRAGEDSEELVVLHARRPGR